MTVLESGFDLYDYVAGGGISAFFNLYDAGDVFQDSYNLSLTLTDGADTLYSHSGFQAYLGDGRGSYPSVAATIQAAFDAGSFDATISFDTTTGDYTIAPNTAGWKIDMTFPSVQILPLLGFSSNPSRATSLVSNQNVPYWMTLTEGTGEFVEDYEPDGRVAYVGEARDASNVYMVSEPGSPVYCDFVVLAETHQKTFNWYNALQGSPESYTLEAHFEHARNDYWFLVTHEVGSALHRLREDTCNFRPRRFLTNPPSDDYWSVPFYTYVARAW